MADLPKEETGSIETRWAWAVTIVVTILATIMFEQESFMFALGNAIAWVALGFLLSPVWWGISRLFVKFRWHWYHWFNSAAFTALVLKILYWVIVPLAQTLAVGF